MSAPNARPDVAPGPVRFDDAVAMVRALARPWARERRSLDAAAGQVLAEEIVAAIDGPRSDVAAMDGYAVRDVDLNDAPKPFRIIGEAFAGEACGRPVRRDDCVRIFTGAPMPFGATRVVIQEEVTRFGMIAWIARPGGGEHVRTRGSDFRTGQVMLPAGRVLDSFGLVATAAADCAEVVVWRRPRIAIIATGDEIRAPGTARTHPDAVPDSVSLGVAALIAEWGGELVSRTRLLDDLGALEHAIDAALAVADVVVTIGGASVGERDHAKTGFAGRGRPLHFTKVAMRPGKPVWLGQVGRAFVLGLPGNPTSAMVTARLFLAPLVAGLSGRSPDTALDWREQPLGTPLDGNGGFDMFLRAREEDRRACVLRDQGSGAQRVLADATMLLRRRPGAPAVRAGAAVMTLRMSGGCS